MRITDERDDRDDRLGTALDAAVSGLGSHPPDVDRLMRRGTWRRVAVVAASLVTVAVFVGAVGFAATRIGSDAGYAVGGTEAPSTFASPDYAWTMPVPDGWHAFATRTLGGPQDMIQDLRTSLVTDSAADLRGVLSVASELPPGVADSDVIVFVDPFVGTGAAEPTTLVLGAERDDDSNAGWTWRDGKVCGGPGCARVYLWHGPDASAAALDAGLGIAEGVRVVESQPNASGLTPTIVFQDYGRNAFWVEYPAGWTIADEALAPDLFDPREILSVGTFPLRPGGTAPTEAFLPGNAIADIGPDDVFITVQERRSKGGGSAHPARPERFGPDTGCAPDDAGCLAGTALAIEGLHAWWIPFSDPPSGRDLYAFVAMGESAYRDPARSAAAWAVLDSLAFDGSQLPTE